VPVSQLGRFTMFPLAKLHVIMGLVFSESYTNAWLYEDEVGGNGKCEANLERRMLKAYLNALR